ncbi:hypothetical protein S40285_10491 [Stachybotrys chlorohalonatus IBT 40285]|uniref:Uncharacterized protein n=1 Tax=Stachybotrys chlorohalonatus (strain IBT 40285) TaxID=1283841 RepID=A0A084QXD0_STAC4|nr:hypothetical protein S40285_10491 [Stachybotrys chlorohalonata IBT 40285]
MRSLTIGSSRAFRAFQSQHEYRLSLSDRPWFDWLNRSKSRLWPKSLLQPYDPNVLWQLQVHKPAAKLYNGAAATSLTQATQTTSPPSHSPTHRSQLQIPIYPTPVYIYPTRGPLCQLSV